MIFCAYSQHLPGNTDNFLHFARQGWVLFNWKWFRTNQWRCQYPRFFFLSVCAGPSIP